MNHRQIIEAKLLEAGIKLDNDELDQLATTYATLLKWEAVVQGMLQPESEPALIFQAKPEV